MVHRALPRCECFATSRLQEAKGIQLVDALNTLRFRVARSRSKSLQTPVAITSARYRTLVVDEMFTAGTLPPNGRVTELGSPYIRCKGLLAHFGCMLVGFGCRDAVEIEHDQWARLNKSSVSATVVNVGCIPHPGVLSTLREPLQLGPASICTSGVGPSRQRWREGRV